MKIPPAFAVPVAAILIAGGAGVATAQTPAKASGGMLTDPSGMTLYTLEKDPAGSGKSTCDGQCATNWPPHLAQDGAKPDCDYSVITRDDGKKQWAYKGKPLYTWSKDRKPGDKGGDGINNVWHAAKP